jgi:hypothetical protein
MSRLLQQRPDLGESGDPVGLSAANDFVDGEGREEPASIAALQAPAGAVIDVTVARNLRLELSRVEFLPEVLRGEPVTIFLPDDDGLQALALAENLTGA